MCEVGAGGRLWHLKGMDAIAKKTAQLLRPIVFDEQIGRLVVLTLAAGASITDLCRRPGYPTPWVLRRWCDEHSDFALEIATAQQVRAGYLVDEAMMIADDDEGDYTSVICKNGEMELVFNHQHVNRAKLRVDTRKWVASRLFREAWGESKHINVDAKILTVQLTDEALDRQLAAATAKLQVIDITPIISDE